MWETGPIKSLLGLAASLGLTASAPLFGMLPPWLPDLKEWGGTAAIFVGVLATLGIFIGQCLRNMKTWNEIKAQNRHDMQEIQKKNEEQVCLNRRLSGVCPMKKHEN